MCLLYILLWQSIYNYNAFKYVHSAYHRLFRITHTCMLYIHVIYTCIMYYVCKYNFGILYKPYFTEFFFQMDYEQMHVQLYSRVKNIYGNCSKIVRCI